MEGPFEFESSDRLDAFYKPLSTRPEMAALWNVVRSLLVLSHGQATVERGFSVNKETTADNIKERCLVGRRAICDHVASVGGIAKVIVRISHTYFS